MLCQGILQLLLNRALERPRAVDRIEADLDQLAHKRIADLQTELTLREPRTESVQLNGGNTPNLLLAQRVKHHRLVHAVDELGAKVLCQHAHYRRFHRVVMLVTGEFLNQVRSEVGRHHDNRIAKIHGAALAVGQAAVFQHLEQDVEHIGMCFLHFIQQQQRIGATPNRLGKITALLVAYIARRRADKPGHRVFLHKLGHVHTHQRLLAVKQKLGQRFAQLGLAYAGRSQKQEGTIRAMGIGETGPRATHRVRHRKHGFILSEHPALQHALHAQQLVALAFKHFGDGNARPARHHLGDLLLADLVAQQGPLGAFDRLGLSQSLFKCRQPSVLEFRHARQIPRAARSLQVELHLFNIALDGGGALQ